jgi:hypothetical protein
LRLLHVSAIALPACVALLATLTAGAPQAEPSQCWKSLLNDFLTFGRRDVATLVTCVAEEAGGKLVGPTLAMA